MKIFSSAFSAFKVHADRVAEGFGYAVHFVPKASLSSSIRTEGTSTQQAAVPLSPETDVGDSGYDHAFYIPPTLEAGLSSSVEVDAGSTLHRNAQLKLSVHHKQLKKTTMQ